jgi:hypothetical protein
VQGAKIAVVNSQDLIRILMIHAKMSSLRHAAANTYVEVNSGGVAVIARAVQAATNPTEGQRMLQINDCNVCRSDVGHDRNTIQVIHSSSMCVWYTLVLYILFKLELLCIDEFLF